MSLRATVSTVVLPMILAIIPGWGHIWLHRKQLGLGLFMLFFASLNFALVYDFLFESSRFGPWAVRIAWATAIATMAYSLFDVFRGTVWSKTPSVQRRRRRYLRRAVRHLIRSEHGQSQEALNRMLRMNPTDVTAHIYLAMSHESAGRPKSALESWRRARAVDHSRHWRVDIDANIRALQEAMKR